jgi:hypothetical protein
MPKQVTLRSKFFIGLVFFPAKHYIRSRLAIKGVPPDVSAPFRHSGAEPAPDSDPGPESRSGAGMDAGFHRHDGYDLNCG